MLKTDFRKCNSSIISSYSHLSPIPVKKITKQNVLNNQERIYFGDLGRGDSWGLSQSRPPQQSINCDDP